jgi:glutamate--cysteine ligase
MKFGMEKEFLIFDENKKPLLKNVLELPKNITLDYADHQFEIVSDVFDTVEELYCDMHRILDEDVVVKHKMWPLSQPGSIDYEFTCVGTNDNETVEYRHNLMKKYPKEMLLISGIHMNISLDDEDIVDKHEYYFDLMKKIYLFGPILQQFVGYTPSMYIDGNKLSDYEDAISLRNTHLYGYYNEKNLDLCFDDYNAYINSVETAIKNNVIQSKKELYAKVRFKETRGNPYLELRFIDLNPYHRLGISYEYLELLSIFTKFVNNIEINEFNLNVILDNFENVALYGQNKELTLNINGHDDTLYNHTNYIFNFIISQLTDDKEIKIMKDIIEQYNTNTTDLDKMISELSTLSIDEFGWKHAIQTKKFNKTYEEYDLELSTKILMEEAESQGYKVEVLDDLNNVIAINDELFVQATKTNVDTYANVLMLENKYMTKKILAKHQIAVPRGERYKRYDQIDYNLFIDTKMVVKPEDTNFGIGISMLEKNPSKEVIDRAINLAFDNSDRILVEETIEGTEYRFLVIDDTCVSIIKRVPAHVIGDGIHSIEELVAIKNTNPYRSTGYVTPVELIKLGDFEVDFIKQSGYNSTDIVDVGVIVNLRNNSNVSTGGDTVEMLEQVPAHFKQVAVDATIALGAKICGIDMIIEDLFDVNQKYGIIEANFNPAIQMHTYPLVGFGKTPAKNILDLVFNK